MLDRASLLAALPLPGPDTGPLVAAADRPAATNKQPVKLAQGSTTRGKKKKKGGKWRAPSRRNQVAQQKLSKMEYTARLSTTQQVSNINNLSAVRQQEAQAQGMAFHPVKRSELSVGMMRPVWMKDALVLARRVSSRGTDYVQGCWLDWPALRDDLLDDVVELLPGARLVRLVEEDSQGRTRRLASLPVTLVPGSVEPLDLEGLSPIQISLLIAWGCILLAALAVFVLLRGAVVLSERRGAFVSAVTHELRTPLTTFRMYTEMLADGMVPDEEKRVRYLKTLHAEADRLDHLVQNVLAYARLERTRKGVEIQEVTLGEILDRNRERLAERASQAGMQLEVEPDESLLAQSLRVDVPALERILFNLVDNASKYAASAEDKRIHLQAERLPDRLVLRVRDHGQGIQPDVARRLFRPFSKSAKDAAESAPGVGLGLALSRRLAQKMGGQLILDETVSDGACFELVLPLA
jgi:signal transduction histidine kinase